MIILNVFSLSIPTLLHFSQVGKPILDRRNQMIQSPQGTSTVFGSVSEVRESVSELGFERVDV